MFRSKDRHELAELREQRGALVDLMRALITRAESQKRDFTEREDDEFGTWERRARSVEREIDRLEREQDGRRAPGWVTPNMTPSRALHASGRTPSELGPEQRLAENLPAAADDRRLSPEEAQEFSLGRAVRGLATGMWTDAELEQRVVQETVNVQGGFLTPEILGATIIDRIRPQAQVLNAGATVVPVLSDQHSIPRLTGGVTGTWRSENAPVTEETPTFDRITFTVKSLATLVKMSYELLADAIPSTLDGITNDITQSLALSLDAAALRGTGVAPQPLGLRNQTGVTIQSLGANGATLAGYDALVNAVSAVQQGNIQPNAALLAARTAKSIALSKDSTGQPLEQPALLDGVEQLVTNQIPTNLTQGTATTASEIYVGRWSDLLIGVRPSISVSIQRLSERFADNLQIGILAYVRADVQVRHPESFAVVTGVL